MKRLSIALASVAIVAGCGGQKSADKADEAEKAEHSDKADKVGTEVVEAEDNSEQLSVSAETPVNGGEHIEAEPAGPLTDEEKRLIEADPEDLTRDERRKRGYALRKKIMQDPDSPKAQSILQGAKAIENGEMEVPPEFKTLHADTSSESEPAQTK